MFGNDGRRVITDTMFPPPNAKGVALYATDGRVRLTSLVIHRLRGLYETSAD